MRGTLVRWSNALLPRSEYLPAETRNPLPRREVAPAIAAKSDGLAQIPYGVRYHTHKDTVRYLHLTRSVDGGRLALQIAAITSSL